MTWIGLGVTFDLLRPTYLTSLLIPGIVLIIVGIFNIAAVFSAMKKGRNQYNWSLEAGISIVGSIVAVIQARPETVHSDAFFPPTNPTAEM